MRLIYYTIAYRTASRKAESLRAILQTHNIRSANFCSVEKFIETAAKCSPHNKRARLTSSHKTKYCAYCWSVCAVAAVAASSFIFEGEIQMDAGNK
jgi:hypothetical protein